MCPNEYLDSSTLMKSLGSGVEFDYEGIISTIESVDLESTNVMVIFHFAAFYEKYGNFASAIDLYSRIYHIHNDASYRLGKLYLLGVDTTPPEPNGTLAAFYFKEAAGKAKATIDGFLGKLYSNLPTSKIKSKNI